MHLQNFKINYQITFVSVSTISKQVNQIYEQFTVFSFLMFVFYDNPTLELEVHLLHRNEILNRRIC